MCVLVAQSFPTLCNPTNYNPPGSSVHGILQARILEWVAISFSRGSSQPRVQSQVSHIAGRFFTFWATREAKIYRSLGISLTNFQLLPICSFHLCSGFKHWKDWIEHIIFTDSELDLSRPIFYSKFTAFILTSRSLQLFFIRIVILKPMLIIVTCMHAWVHAQACPTLCNPMDYSPPGSSVHGVFQARILKWVAISSARGSFWPRNQTRIPGLLHWQADSLPPCHLGSHRA